MPYSLSVGTRWQVVSNTYQMSSQHVSTTTGRKTKFSEPYSYMAVAGQLMPVFARSQNTCSSACNCHRTEPLRLISIKIWSLKLIFQLS